MSKVSIEGIGTQPPAVQQALVAAVGTATPDKDGLVRLLVAGIVYVGKLFIMGRKRRFLVDSCERQTAPAKAAKKAVKKAAKAAPKAKRSSAKATDTAKASDGTKPKAAAKKAVKPQGSDK